MSKSKRKREREEREEKMWKKIKELEEALRGSMSNTQLPKQVATQSSGASKLAAESDNEKTPLSTGDKQQLDNLPPESKSTEMSPIVKPTPESGKSNDVESLKDPNTSGGVTESDKKENAPEKLDVEIIEILGEDPLAEDPQVGVLHSEIATRWSNLISNGLKKELKSDLLAKYPRASNCQLEAQTLNPEVAASMQDTAVKRDKFACEIQNIIGSAMLALGKGISLMLEEKEDGNSFENCEPGKLEGPILQDAMGKDGEFEINATDKSNGVQCSEETVSTVVSIPAENVTLADGSPSLTSKVSTTAGRLKFFVNKWREITDNKFVLNCILGYQIEFDKPVLQINEPKNLIRFWINSERLTFELPESKRLKILELVRRMRGKKECKIRDLAKFIGNLIAACPAIKYGWLYTKAFEREKYLALVENENNYEGKVQLKENLTEDFACNNDV
ncbi:Protein of unknown function [Cotesia congregata]|uniref:Uncharacterized protein n=1 Tax=Cotesia congregata TaxID=51543 RepID=A0A8J2HBQ2_COTCN|nr:Protein of unknown function [Cotesia congregata]